jgi:ATP-dependent metalloprotease FtsH
VRKITFEPRNNTNPNQQIYSIRNMTRYILPKAYPLSRSYHESYLKRLNSKNITIQGLQILSGDELQVDETNLEQLNEHPFFRDLIKTLNGSNYRISGIRTTSSPPFNDDAPVFQNSDDDDDDFAENLQRNGFRGFGFIGNNRNNRGKKSDNYEVVYDHNMNFNNVGGYDKIKKELQQCVDILSNYTKYTKYNVRIPRGLILEGPPGNGKTLLAKAFAGEAGLGFISVSGSEFQEKYVGVGASRIRELFTLANRNSPCIVFIDEIDAVGRKRSGDGESSTSERDSTLNELLVALDGFKNNTGVFIIGATNRVDLLDPALLRPGRIDKQIFIGNPDDKTRKAILDIHLQGKPYDKDNISSENLVDLTQGLSGAQIENLLNEGMLNALRENREQISNQDLDYTMNKMVAGWQPNEHQFTSDIVDHIAIHEMGHAIVGILSKHHSKMTKVVINLSSPRTPGYTMFEPSASNIHTREALFEHLAILLAGRIAEEVCYDVSVTTGAINDFEEAFKLAEKMIIYYGMGKSVIYPNSSEKYKEKIDNEVHELIDSAYAYSVFILQQCKEILTESAEILKKDKLIMSSQLDELIDSKYPQIRNIK